MAIVDLVMPKMGESIMEATILKWHKQVGDAIKMDETMLEIATDKVDSEVPSTAAGTITAILFNVNDVVPVGTVIAQINTDGGAAAAPAAPHVNIGNRPEERVPMSRLRARIAERLLESQANNAILTTFNEVNMGPVIALRNKYKDKFEKEHGVKLGFMSFFVSDFVVSVIIFVQSIEELLDIIMYSIYIFNQLL